MTREECDIWQSAGIFIRSRIEGLCNDHRFIEAEELEQAYKCINEHFDNALDFDINFKPVISEEPQTDYRDRAEINRVKTELEPCETVGNSDKLDCISRELVINYLISEWHKELRDIIQDIRQLPSVTLQEPKTGRWIEYTKVIIPEPFNRWKQAWKCSWKCSECGYGSQDDEDGWLEWKYCPNCGAKMQEVKE